MSSGGFCPTDTSSAGAMTDELISTALVEFPVLQTLAWTDVTGLTDCILAEKPETYD
jgi:hypothetical protein